MKPLHNLACALMAWSSLASLAQAGNQSARLLSLPPGAFQHSLHTPGQMVYLTPGTDLKRYHSLIIAPLAILDRSPQGHWQLLETEASHPLNQYYRRSLSQALAQHQQSITDHPAPGVARLRLAVSRLKRDGSLLDNDATQAIDKVVALAHRGTGMDAYLLEILAMGQLEDALTGKLLAGEADLADSGANSIANAEPANASLQQRIDQWNRQNALRLAQVLANGAVV